MITCEQVSAICKQPSQCSADLHLHVHMHLSLVSWNLLQCRLKVHHVNKVVLLDASDLLVSKNDCMHVHHVLACASVSHSSHSLLQAQTVS